MKLFITILLIFGVSYANENKEFEKILSEMKIQEMKILNDKYLTKRQKDFLVDKIKKDVENEKLEADGFCACNNE